MVNEGPASPAEKQTISAELLELLRQRLALRRDLEAAPELVREAEPVAVALDEGLAAVGRGGDEAQLLREARALTSLLGRRAARLGVTPTATLELAGALMELTDAKHPLQPRLRASFVAVCIEGYVAACEELQDEVRARELADSIPAVEMIPGGMAVFLSGRQDPEELRRALEEVGRQLFEREARACLVHLGGLLEPSESLATQVFALHATCRMLGATCVFAGVGDGWRQAARERGIALEELTFVPDFATGLVTVLENCGTALRSRAGLGEVLKRLVGRKD